MEENSVEIIKIVFGSVELSLPKSKVWITKVRKLLDMLEEDISDEPSKEDKKVTNLSQEESTLLRGMVERPTNVLGHAGLNKSDFMCKAPDGGEDRPLSETGAGKENAIQTLPHHPEAAFKLIPKFEWDKSKEKNYRTIFFFEHDDGKVMISYFNFKTFTTKEAVLSIPFPVPYRYTPLGIFTGNRRAAIRLYREYLFNEARNAEVQGAVKRDEGQEEKDAQIEREAALRKKAEINAARWKPQEKEMSARTKELRKNIVAKLTLGVGSERRNANDTEV